MSIPFRLAGILAVAAVSLFAGPPRAASGGDPADRLVPVPVSIRADGGAMPLGPASRIVAADPRLEPLAGVLAEEIALTTGLRLRTAAGDAGAGDVALTLDGCLAGEEYALRVDDRAEVKGGNYFSVASGTVTLLQLIEKTSGGLRIPRVTVADRPAYPYRGVLIDLARKYHSPGGIEQVIEMCRLYKVRYLHVHLSDDQLFMFPSTRFPQLGKGNWEFSRFEPGSRPRIDPYTIEELRGLERFSQERGVHIVPEMDQPGHSGRLVGDAPETFAFPGNGSTVNIASEKTVAGVATLLEEIMDVFRGTPYVHLGGDEVGLGGLEGTAEFQELQKRCPEIRGAHDLYCKFIRDMHDVIARRGKRTIVWEEAFNPGGAFPLPLDTLVMIWCQGRSPAEVARAGYELVNATWTPLYIVRDNRKSLEFLHGWDVTKFGREGSNDYTVLADDGGKLSGAQLCSWENSESIEIASMRGRLAIVAERTWNPRARGSFAAFERRLAATDALLDDLIHPIAVEVEGKFTRGENTFEEPIVVRLTPKRPGLAIRYTLDNSLPNPDWKEYSGPIAIERTAHLRAGLFDGEGRQQGYLVGAWFQGIVPVRKNLATGKPVTVGPGPDRSDAWGAKNAVDGRIDDVWAHWASTDPAPQWLQVDLGKVYPIDSIKAITFHDGSRHYQLDARVSVDGKEWRKVLEFRDTAPATADGYAGRFPVTDARFVRVDMLKNSANPYVHIVELIVDGAK